MAVAAVNSTKRTTTSHHAWGGAESFVLSLTTYLRATSSPTPTAACSSFDNRRSNPNPGVTIPSGAAAAAAAALADKNPGVGRDGIASLTSS